jgi:hypothetical protein
MGCGEGDFPFASREPTSLVRAVSVDRVEQVDTLSYVYGNLWLEDSLPIKKEVYPLYP